MNRRTFYFLTAALTYLLALTIVGATGKDAPETAATQPSRPTEPAFRVALAAAQGATAQAGAGYVGEATCLGCHEDQAYKGTAHGRVQRADAGGEPGVRKLPRSWKGAR